MGETSLGRCRQGSGYQSSADSSQRLLLRRREAHRCRDRQERQDVLDQPRQHGRLPQRCQSFGCCYSGLPERQLGVCRSWCLSVGGRLHLHQCHQLPHKRLQVLLHSWSPLIHQGRDEPRRERCHPRCQPRHCHFSQQPARYRSHLDSRCSGLSTQDL